MFMMGKFEARFPTDRQYVKSHLWAQARGGSYRFGFAAYAVRLLQDVYFLEWSVDAGARLKLKQEIGAIESSKAESDLYAPAAGVLTEFNEDLLQDPTPINTDKYGRGWLFEIEPSGPVELLSPEQYLVHLEQAWQVAQKTIKGQIQ